MLNYILTHTSGATYSKPKKIVTKRTVRWYQPKELVDVLIDKLVSDPKFHAYTARVNREVLRDIDNYEDLAEKYK